MDKDNIGDGETVEVDQGQGVSDIEKVDIEEVNGFGDDMDEVNEGYIEEVNEEEEVDIEEVDENGMDEENADIEEVDENGMDEEDVDARLKTRTTITLGVISIPKIEDVASIKSQISVPNPTIDKILENCTSAIEQCPFKGLDSINYTEVKETFMQVLDMLDEIRDDKISGIGDTISFQLENLNDAANFDKLWAKFAKTELPQITWFQIDQNNPLAVDKFIQDYKTNIEHIFYGFKESLFRSIVFAMIIAEVKQFVGLLGLWDQVKDYYNAIPFDKKRFEPIADDDPSGKSLPTKLLERLKTNLLKKSEAQIQEDWLNGNRFQLTHNRQMGSAEIYVSPDLECCMHSLRNGVSFEDGSLAKTKFEQLETSYQELEQLRDKVIRGAVTLMF